MKRLADGCKASLDAMAEVRTETGNRVVDGAWRVDLSGRCQQQ